MDPPNALLAALNCASATHLVIGSNPLAATRCTQSLGAGAHPVVVAPPAADVHYALQKHVDAGAVKRIEREFRDDDLFTLGREEVGGVVDAVFVTVGPRDPLCTHISALCKRNRIPVNVVDAPHLCTFSLLSTHTDGPLQIGVTTNGHGCKLSSRIRRELSSSLPPDLGAACARLGDLRRRIQEEDRPALAPGAGGADDVEESVDQGAGFNRLVTEADADEARNRRARWLAQVCEYWPLRKLAALTDEDIAAVFSSPIPSSSLSLSPPAEEGHLTPMVTPTKPGTLILAGSGPGSPDLLTRATYKAIQTAHLILADKLVPSQILDLIPRRTPLHIARKFPGNAEAAQAELLSRAIAAVREGKVVVRLKQGDPFLYGRGGEEVAFFKAAGLGDRVVVLPGVTSALSAPLFAGVPVTQRDVADQVLVCTGTGKKGVPPAPPEYVASRTVVFLMALHRIGGLVAELTTYVEADGEGKEAEGEAGGKRAARVLWPTDTPCAVIERASCPDQRVIRTTLGHVAEAIEQEGSRPPGLLVVGKACEALYTPEKGRAWVVEEGFRGLDVEGLATL
ncbi:related to siroheme synthase (Uroporphyrin-III C-methyltransferase) [Cephalotrichum gorgonifer]|uniref:Related to siroheme synthase (Uroporphyrin-III C-methyltransferase) n=1 Tax=Cephalotrichum gorgonifer TaxID=2041049 RepID=A0AAE8MU90_9PEZI|nr:related to siroheme synthase (Uroporphyrin-III C-methyltransferase) [Cephalotrichum gorgonifer]